MEYEQLQLALAMSASLGGEASRAEEVYMVNQRKGGRRKRPKLYVVIHCVFLPPSPPPPTEGGREGGREQLTDLISNPLK